MSSTRSLSDLDKERKEVILSHVSNPMSFPFFRNSQEASGDAIKGEALLKELMHRDAYLLVEYLLDDDKKEGFFTTLFTWHKGLIVGKPTYDMLMRHYWVGSIPNTPEMIVCFTACKLAVAVSDLLDSPLARISKTGMDLCRIIMDRENQRYRLLTNALLVMAEDLSKDPSVDTEKMAEFLLAAAGVFNSYLKEMVNDKGCIEEKDRLEFRVIIQNIQNMTEGSLKENMLEMAEEFVDDHEKDQEEEKEESDHQEPAKRRCCSIM